MVKKHLGFAKRFILNRIDTPAIVLLYHRVTTLDRDPQLLSVDPENFYNQIDFLRKHCTLLGIEEFSDLLIRRKKMPRRAAIITFDDGYADNYIEARPILETLNSQALFYISTSNLGTEYELWWDELERILLNCQSLPAYLEIEMNGSLVRAPVSSTKGRENLYNTLHPYLKKTPPVYRDALIDTIRMSAGLPKEGRTTHRLLTIDELKKLSLSPAAVIGAHTHNHPSLSSIPYNEQKEEIDRSKIILEKNLSRTINHFSYPYGSKKDYTFETILACREIGFKMVCSNYYSQVHRWTDCLQVPRILVRNWNRETFKNFISKCFIN